MPRGVNFRLLFRAQGGQFSVTEIMFWTSMRTVPDALVLRHEDRCCSYCVPSDVSNTIMRQRMLPCIPLGNINYESMRPTIFPEVPLIGPSTIPVDVMFYLMIIIVGIKLESGRI